MELIYSNFDNLDITFQGSLPENILNQLARGRELAQQEKRDVPIKLGEIKMIVMIGETGARGGYRYRFDTGIDGETWMVAHSTNSEGWNIRVSSKSLALALHGYEGVKERILNRLEALNARGMSRRDTASQAVTNIPLERISRIDYCFDFIMDSAFEPLPNRFISHQRTKRHVYGEHGAIPNYSALNGDKINTIRIGSMPRRQVTIYNKTKEIIDSKKSYWWDIWGLDKKSFKDGFKQIWRIEVRAGKEELDKWPLKRFKEFDLKAGDVIQDLLKGMRYTEPLKGDSNRSRWPMHPIWAECLKASLKALEPYSTNAIREHIIKDYRDNVIKGYKERLIGNLIGYSVALNRDISELPEILKLFEEEALKEVNESPKIFKKKYLKVEERYEFIDIR